MQNVLTLINKQSSILEYKKIISKPNYSLFAYNVSTNTNLYLTYITYLNSNESVFYIASNIYKATIAYENLVSLAGIDSVNFYVMDDFSSSEALASSNEYKYERMYTIDALAKGEKKIIVCNLAAILRYINPLEDIKSHMINISTGDNIDIKKIITSLIEAGYKRSSVVEVVGEFSVRGEILDIYPINLDHPIRIDFFDDEVDYIKYFNPETQKSESKLEEASILPVSEVYYADPYSVIDAIKRDAKSQETQSFLAQEMDDFINYNYSLKMLKYIKYFCEKPAKIIDFCSKKTLIFEEYSNLSLIEEKINKEAYDFLPKDIYKELNVAIFSPLLDLTLDANKTIYLSEFKSSLNGIKLTDMVDINSSQVMDYKGNVALLAKELNFQKKSILIGYINNERKNTLVEMFKANDLKVSEIDVLTNFKISEINICNIDNPLSVSIGSFTYLSEQNIFKKAYEKLAKYRSAYKDLVPLNSKEDIEIGEYVVHYDYGIAKYKGIKEVELNNIKNDYLVLEFANMDLLVPIEKISMLDKYQATEGSIPKLSRIGTKEWEKKKSQVKEKLVELAGSLIKTQALRDSKQGFTYSADDEAQILFESDFEYEETPDQLKTIEEIKADMEAGKVIDRLVCGDVGYGKTEVALRIAFKTVKNGLQVAYLAPTTILTRQHYYLFKNRLESYGINVAIINRFVSQKEINDIYVGLQNGTIDIVIGTHALLNDKIRYKNLGLLIVDEEQRFGVEHKEKIKQYKSLVNVLTLTATPIPRTLQMALVGARQLSLIETPPKNRYPIKTYVLEYNDIVIREAIYNELARGGQVFYLYNRISTLDRVYSHLKKLVPEARIAIAHGRMEKDALEDIIQAFIDKEYDVLLCTTIIETGIDIPNTNTLIVQMADRLGLSQMYQIRGRVGRSDRLAYAYFVYDQGKILTQNSSKRLSAIKEFTTLGSGYKIALRDLAIRGAGDILGREQSGFIDDIGLDLYMRLLKEEIDHLQGKDKQEQSNPSWNVEVSKHVDSSYVSDDEIRIYIHRKIDAIANRNDKEALVNELVDRFGRLSEELKLYIDKKYFDILASKCHVEKIKDNVSSVQLCFTEEFSNNVDASKIFQIAYTLSSKFSFEYKNKKIFVKYLKANTKAEWINTLSCFFEEIINTL